MTVDQNQEENNSVNKKKGMKPRLTRSFFLENLKINNIYLKCFWSECLPTYKYQETSQEQSSPATTSELHRNEAKGQLAPY